jgi:TldD protein
MDKNLKKKVLEIFTKSIELGKEKGIYVDCNFLSKKEKRFVLDKEITISKDNDVGIKIRLFANNQWYEFAYSILDYDTIISEIQHKIHTLLKQGPQHSYQEMIGDEVQESNEYLNASCSIPLEEKQKTLQHLQEKISQLDSDITLTRIIYVEKYETHIFKNAVKECIQEIPLYVIATPVFVKAHDGSSKMPYQSVVSSSFQESILKIEKSMDEFKLRISQFKQSKTLQPGKYDSVLSPYLTGLLAHESFGHGMEADTMMKQRALALEYLGKQLGPDFVNIVDYPLVPGKHGFYYVDHEGNKAQKTYLVKHGVLQTPIADMYSSKQLQLQQNNNSRMESFDHKNYVRMSNTYFEQGDKTKEELIAQVKDGIFIIEARGGMEDPKSWGVQIQGCFGQRIKNGKLIDEFYDGFSLTGFLPTILKNIKGVSNKVEIEGGGFCGKGHKEWVRVSEGGPYMLINEVVLG